MGSTAVALQQLLQPLLEVNLEGMLHLQQLVQLPLPLADLLLLLQLHPLAASCSLSRTALPVAHVKQALTAHDKIGPHKRDFVASSASA